MGRGPEETFQRHTGDQQAQEKMLRLPGGTVDQAAQ